MALFSVASLLHDFPKSWPVAILVKIPSWPNERADVVKASWGCSLAANNIPRTDGLPFCVRVNLLPGQVAFFGFAAVTDLFSWRFY